MPIITWVCETCGERKEAGMRPPVNWCEISFWHGSKERFVRYSFCSYSCAGKWCQGRYDEPRDVRDA